MVRIFIPITQLLIAFVTSASLQAKTDIEVEWREVNQSSLVTQAKKYFQDKELPEVARNLSIKIDIEIDDNIVTKSVKHVLYLPNFTQAHDNGTQTIYWDQAVQKLTIYEAATVLPDLSYQRLDPKTIRVRDSDEYNTFTNNKEVLLPLAGIAGKGIIVLEYQKRTKLDDLEGIYGDMFYPVYFTQGVDSYELNFKAQESFKFSWSNSVQGLACRKNDNSLNCVGNSLEPMEYEEGMAWRDEVPFVMIAESKSWQQVSDFVRSKIDLNDHYRTEVKEKAKELVAGAESTKDQIAKLHEFASRGIRYVSMSELGHRITPHSFSHVVDNLYGDCKDKSSLLRSLLKSIGIDAYLMLVSTDRRDLDVISVPSTQYFDHMVVCFEYGEEEYCLDPTDNNTNWQSVSSWIQGRMALPLTEKAQLRTVPEEKYKWVMRYFTKTEFDSDAGVTETQERKYQGVYASTMRSGFNSLQEDERQEWLLENYNNNVSSLTSPEFELNGLEGMGSDLTVSSNTRYEPYLEADESLNSSDYDAWLRSELNSYKLEDSIYGRWVDGLYMESTAIYDVDALWSVTRVPAKLDYTHRSMSMKRKSKINAEGNVEVSTEVWVPGQFVKSGKIEDFNRRIDIFIRASSLPIKGSLKSEE